MLQAGYLGGVVRFPAGPGQSLGGAQGTKPPGALKVLQLTVLKMGQKLTLVVHVV